MRFINVLTRKKFLVCLDNVLKISVVINLLSLKLLIYIEYIYIGVCCNVNFFPCLWAVVDANL